MERDEFEEDLEQCADCGASVAPDDGGNFVFGERRVLCFECATRRNGEYDEREERWTVSPDLAGLERANEET